MFYFPCLVDSKFLCLVVDPCSDDIFYCSANRGDRFDKAIDNENKQNSDFIILVCFMDHSINYKAISKYQSVLYSKDMVFHVAIFYQFDEFS